METHNNISPVWGCLMHLGVRFMAVFSLKQFAYRVKIYQKMLDCFWKHNQKQRFVFLQKKIQVNQFFK